MGPSAPMSPRDVSGAVDYRKLETEGSSWSLDTSLLYTAQMTLPIETEKKQMTCSQPFSEGKAETPQGPVLWVFILKRTIFNSITLFLPAELKAILWMIS